MRDRQTKILTTGRQPITLMTDDQKRTSPNDTKRDRKTRSSKNIKDTKKDKQTTRTLTLDKVCSADGRRCRNIKEIKVASIGKEMRIQDQATTLKTKEGRTDNKNIDLNR